MNSSGARVGIAVAVETGSIAFSVNGAVVAEVPARVDTFQPLYGVVDLVECGTRSVTVAELKTPPRTREVQQKVGVRIQFEN